MKTFERLLQSKIPLDWTTIRLGWHGLKAEPLFSGLHIGADLLTTDELLAYARSQVGSYNGEESDLVFDLASCDASNAWEIQRCLDHLATNDPDVIRRAERIWRWALMNEFVNDLEQTYETYIGIPSRHSWEQDEWAYEVSWEIERFWKDYGLPVEDISFVQDWQHLLGSKTPSAKEVLSKPREWLEKEKERLMLLTKS